MHMVFSMSHIMQNRTISHHLTFSDSPLALNYAQYITLIFESLCCLLFLIHISDIFIHFDFEPNIFR